MNHLARILFSIALLWYGYSIGLAKPHATKDLVTPVFTEDTPRSGQTSAPSRARVQGDPSISFPLPPD